MLVQPVPLIIQQDPEHLRLEQYIVDNPEVKPSCHFLQLRDAGGRGWSGLGDRVPEGGREELLPLQPAALQE